MSKLNYSLIARTLSSQVSNLWRMEDEYLRGHNREAAKNVRDEIGRINEQIELLKALAKQETEVRLPGEADEEYLRRTGAWK